MLINYLVDALSLGGIYALVALGLALTFGVARLLNFAYGELLMICGFTLFSVPGPFVVVAILAIFLAVVAALLMDLIAFRPVRNAAPSTTLITSFAVSVLLQNVALAIYGGRPKSAALPPALSNFYVIGGVQVELLDLLTIGSVFLLLALLVLFLRRTSIGVQMRATAEDISAARLAGVRANVVIAATFCVSGVLAGVAAVFVVAKQDAISPTMGLMPVLIGFVAIVVGGFGTLVGAVVGGFLLGGVTVAVQALLPSGAGAFRDALVFLIAILVLLFRPSGIVRSNALVERV